LGRSFRFGLGERMSQKSACRSLWAADHYDRSRQQLTFRSFNMVAAADSPEPEAAWPCLDLAATAFASTIGCNNSALLWSKTAQHIITRERRALDKHDEAGQKSVANV
jgi:hypothetical protein